MKIIIKLYLKNICIEKTFCCFGKSEDDKQVINDLVNILNKKMKEKKIDDYKILTV